jgi:hypothetical protein
MLSSRQFTILKIPVKDVSECLTKGIISICCCIKILNTLMQWHGSTITFQMHHKNSVISTV